MYGYSDKGSTAEGQAFLPGGSNGGLRKTSQRWRTGIWSRLCGSIFILVAVCLLGLFSSSSFWRLMSTLNPYETSARPALKCRNPRVRREWRALSNAEKHEYFDAVYCLLQEPPILANRSLYDDYPYVHNDIGGYSHDSANFLPWHRYFIQLFENHLAERCDYRGGLPYWNWVLDYKDIRKSPVFDVDHGFGGNGDEYGNITVGSGRCVVDGPFAGVWMLRYDGEYHPHCLSRGFLNEEGLAKICKVDAHPDTIAHVLSRPTYEELNDELNDGAHHGIPTCIGGDWRTFTVPNDPLWWLHHAQMDRLWWLWQRSAPGRVSEYAGKSTNITDLPASVSDLLHYGDFAESVQVAEVLGTESELLCYRYE